MINFELEGAAWRYVPVKRLIRGLVPQFLFLGGRRFGWEITSTEYQPLLTSAVREGTWIALANIRQICNKLGVEPPRSKQGSGKGGSVLKVDWAKQLVEHLFPEASNPEKKRMISALTWKQNKMGGLQDKEQSILEMVSELDEENREAPEFQKVIKLAKQRLKDQERRQTATETRKMVLEEMKRSELEEKNRIETAAAEAALAAEKEKKEKKENAEVPGASGASSSGTRKPSSTPSNLKDFLSPAMQAEKISLNREPAAYGYRAYYPSFFSLVSSAFQKNRSIGISKFHRAGFLYLYIFLLVFWSYRSQGSSPIFHLVIS